MVCFPVSEFLVLDCLLTGFDCSVYSLLFAYWSCDLLVNLGVVRHLCLVVCFWVL